MPRNEWIGARYTLPTKFRDGDMAIQPDVVLWMELPSGLLVDSTVIDPREPVSFAQTLERAMTQPSQGSPRRPARVRVSDGALAEALRELEIPVFVAPVPELDAAFAELSAAMIGDDDEPDFSYLGDGSIAPEVVAQLFTAASTFFRAAPWRDVAENQVVRVDIPAFDVDGACLSVIGGAGESFGLLLFRSLDVYRSFASGPPDRPGAAGPSDGVRSLLSLSFDRKKDIPPPMLREIKDHRWPVGGAKGYPVVISIDAGLNRLPLTERDYRIMTASTLAFLSFFARHGDLFDTDEPEPVCESFTGDDEVTVTLAAPHGDGTLLDVNSFFAESDEPVPPPRPRVGRNDPCPCGSGKKYKKCHLGSEEALQGTESETAHEMDFRLVHEIGRFASSRFGPGWYGDEIEADDALLMLVLPWMAWASVVDGKRVADSFLERHGERLSVRERDWFAAQRNAWLSLWEVTNVVPGTVEVRDLLTGERRAVTERMASRSVVSRDVLLAFVIDFEGVSLFGGLYGRSLAPSDADQVVHAIRSKLRVREGAIALERLRDPALGRFMIERWMDAVHERDERRSSPRQLQNTDGDPLLFVTESFRFVAAKRPEIEKRLAAMDGAESAPGEGDESVFVFFRTTARGRRKRDDTVIGRVLVTTDTLRVETNSERRAEALGRRIRDACAGLLRRAGRKTENPLERPEAGKAEPPEPMSLQEQKLVREYKERHYGDWLNSPIPALGGKTPRAAARSAKSRETLDLLLRDMEHLENRLPAEARFDFRRLRSELGLD